MRIILKLFAAPVVLALTLIVAVLNFGVSLASWMLGILSSVCALCGLFNLFQGDAGQGVYWLVVALSFLPLVCPLWRSGWLIGWRISTTP